jgi:ATP-binding cassette subfamily F protein 3
LAVARMLLRPSNTLLLDEPTNHLDLDSKEVLLDALVDYGGTLIFVSHDRYFVERLATRIIEVGHGVATVYPGTYAEFLWHKDHPEAVPATAATGRASARGATPQGDRRPDAKKPERKADAPAAAAASSREEKKRAEADARRKSRAEQARRARVAEIETRIAGVEQEIRELERAMAVEGFYADRAAAQPTIDRHQALMWEVGDLMHQWEELQSALDLASTPDV